MKQESCPGLDPSRPSTLNHPKHPPISLHPPKDPLNGPFSEPLTPARIPLNSSVMGSRGPVLAPHSPNTPIHTCAHACGTPVHTRTLPLPHVPPGLAHVLIPRSYALTHVFKLTLMHSHACSLTHAYTHICSYMPAHTHTCSHTCSHSTMLTDKLSHSRFTCLIPCY